MKKKLKIDQQFVAFVSSVNISSRVLRESLLQLGSRPQWNPLTVHVI